MSYSPRYSGFEERNQRLLVAGCVCLAVAIVGGVAWFGQPREVTGKALAPLGGYRPGKPLPDSLRLVRPHQRSRAAGREGTVTNDGRTDWLEFTPRVTFTFIGRAPSPADLQDDIVKILTGDHRMARPRVEMQDLPIPAAVPESPQLITGESMSKFAKSMERMTLEWKYKEFGKYEAKELNEVGFDRWVSTIKKLFPRDGSDLKIDVIVAVKRLPPEEMEE